MSPDFSELLQCLESCEVEYLVVGGYSVMTYAEPRFTKDIDIWVRPEAQNAQRVYRALAQFGAPLQDVVVDDFVREGYAFQIGVFPVRVDILMSVDGLTFKDAWPNRVRIDFGGIQAWVIGRADLIANKRACGRPQDLLDLEALERHRE